MNIELDTQEREVIKGYAKTMLALFKRDAAGGGRGTLTGADAMSIAFWSRLALKMDGQTQVNKWPTR